MLVTGALFCDSSLCTCTALGLRLAHSCGLTCTQGVQFYDTWTKTMLDTITFWGYSAAAGVSVILGMTHIDTFTPQAREMELWCLGHLFLKH